MSWLQSFYVWVYLWVCVCIYIYMYIYIYIYIYSSAHNVQSSLHVPIPVQSDWNVSYSSSCLTLCDPMDCSMPGFPVHHQLLELAQTHVHRVGDAVQPSFPLSSPSGFSLSQHQGLFRWVSSSRHVAKVLEFSALASVLLMNIQDWFPLGLTGLILQSKGLWKAFSSTTVQKHQFFCAQISLKSNSHIHTWLLEKP